MRFFQRANVLLVVIVAAVATLTQAGSNGAPLPFLPNLQQERQIAVEAVGSPPWTVEGHGWRYTVESVSRSKHSWMSGTKPTLTITAYIERVENTGNFASMEYRINADDGSVLDGVPFQGGGDGTPPLHQRSKLVHVVWDSQPSARQLTITLHDFYWPTGRDLILRAILVPA